MATVGGEMDHKGISDEPAHVIRDTTREVRIAAVGISVLLFLLSLTQDAYYIWRGNGWGPGFALLLLGWLGVFVGEFAWLANPALVVAWLALWKRRRQFIALAFAVTSLLLALSFLLDRGVQQVRAGPAPINTRNY